ncbi:MAG: ECF-type sigma factor [Verrucomicrobiota bacterium]
MPQVYEELRRLAAYKMRHENPGQTISGTALLHEAYIKLSKESDGPKWANRKQFFSAAAEAMRRILIDRVRAKQAVKRGSDYQRAEVDESNIAAPAPDDQLMAVNDALEALDRADPDSADLVKLRYFAGLTLEEIAETMGSSVSTLTRQWAYARSWLEDRLASDS